MEIGTGKIIGDLNVASGGFAIGSVYTGIEQFNGLLDDVRVYDGALSGTEVAALAAVPEPTSAALLGLGGIALIFRRRK